MTDTFASGPSSPLGGSPRSAQRASDVTSTLAELERKLRELEAELTSIGRLGLATGDLPAVPREEPEAQRDRRAAAGRLIDEAIEHEQPATPTGSASEGPASERPASESPPPAPEPPPRPSEGPSGPELAGLAELRLFRDRLERFARELAEDYEQVLERVMGDFSATAAPTPSIDDTLFEGRVELGVGPFYDIGSLSAFERQVTRVPHAGDVAVRRFEASHAVLDLSLSAPVALVRELRSLVDTGFSVREIAGGRLMLTFDDI